MVRIAPLMMALAIAILPSASATPADDGLEMAGCVALRVDYAYRTPGSGTIPDGFTYASDLSPLLYETINFQVACDTVTLDGTRLEDVRFSWSGTPVVPRAGFESAAAASHLFASSLRVNDASVAAFIKERQIHAYEYDLSGASEGEDGTGEVIMTGSDPYCTTSIHGVPIKPWSSGNPETVRVFFRGFNPYPAVRVLSVLDLTFEEHVVQPTLGRIQTYPFAVIEQSQLMSHACGYCWELGMGVFWPTYQVVKNGPGALYNVPAAGMAFPYYVPPPVDERDDVNQSDPTLVDNGNAGPPGEGSATPRMTPVADLRAGEPGLDDSTSQAAVTSEDGPSQIPIGFPLLAALAVLAAYRLPKWAPAALFTRIQPGRALTHPRRSAIVEYVQAHPGATAMDVRNALGLSAGVFTHHARILETTEHVRWTRISGTRRLFADGVPPAAAPVRHRNRRAIMELVERYPGIDQTALARRLSISRENLSYHTQRLVDRGLLVARRDGRLKRHFLGTNTRSA